MQSETLASPEDDYFSNLMSRISVFLRKSDVAIILPKSVINDVNDDYVVAGDDEEERDTKNTLDYIRQCKSEGVITIRSDETGADTYEDLFRHGGNFNNIS